MTNPPPPPGGFPPPSGDFPPQQGGYPPPPPPGGGYPPPPPPGGGSYPPPPPGGGFPPAPGGFPPPPGAGYPPGAPGYPPVGAPGYGPGPGAYSVGDSLSWAWNKFSKNAVPLIVATVVYGLIISVLFGIFYGIAMSMATSSEVTYGGNSYSASFQLGAGSMLMILLGMLAVAAFVGIVASGYCGGLLSIANGEQVTVGSFFQLRNIGGTLALMLIIFIAQIIGSFCIIGGIAVALFTVFALPALLDRNLSPIDAIKASFDVVTKNLGSVILTALLAYVISAVGSMCFIGALVTVPLSLLMLVYAWRRLTGGPLAPITP